MWPYPSRSVRLFVQNFPRGTTEAELRRHFEAAAGPGDVLGLSLRGFCATVRMRDEAAGERARRELHGRPFLGRRLAVHRFRGIKIFVGGLPPDCGPDDLRPLFQDFGPVAECDVVKDYAFVHMDNEEDGRTAIEHLHGMEFKGSTITVQRSVKDRKHNENREQHSKQETRAGGNTFPDPYYEEQPSASFDHDYRSQPATGQAAAYRNGSESEPYSYPEASSGHQTHSAQSHSYGSKSYDSHNAGYGNQAAYDIWNDAPASYSTQFSDSLSTHDRASVDAAYPSTPDRLASGYGAQSPHSGLPHSQQAASSLGALRPETASRLSLYERVRLSPPPISYDDLYRDGYATSKMYSTKQGDDTYCPPYESVRLSPPQSRRDDFDRRGNGPSKKYSARSESASRHAARSESASRHAARSESASRYTSRRESASRYTARSENASRRRPYERSSLSQPHRSRENHRSYR